MLSHENLLTNTDSILSYLPINNKSVILAIMSFTYSYGNSILLTHTKAGGCIKIYNMSAYPQKVLEELKTVNSFSTVGSYLNTLVKQSNFDASSFKGLEYMTFAGEATSYDLIEHLQHELPDVKFYIMYGQTEASARLSYLEPSMLSKKKGSVGKAIKGVEIKIVDSNDAEVPCEETGEIIVKGKNVMKGYINDSALTDEILRSGWLHTGDIAYKDQEGYLYIVGRCKDIIKRSGYRISPVEIESVLNQYESVLESAVVEDYGENQEAIIKAYIVLKPECLKFSLDELKIFVNHSLPMIKRPQVYEIVPKIPKTMNGKIRRTQLRRG